MRIGNFGCVPSKDLNLSTNPDQPLDCLHEDKALGSLAV